MNQFARGLPKTKERETSKHQEKTVNTVDEERSQKLVHTPSGFTKRSVRNSKHSQTNRFTLKKKCRPQLQATTGPQTRQFYRRGRLSKIFNRYRSVRPSGPSCNTVLFISK